MAGKTSHGNWPTSAPTLKSQALGRIPEHGVLSIATTVAASLTIRLWNPGAERWEKPGSASTDYTKTFASGEVPAFDYFRGPPKALFHIVSSASSNAGYSNADDV